MDVNSYYKAAAYGCLYKAYGDTVDERKAGDITVSLLRDARPEGCSGILQKTGTGIRNVRPGIYCLSGNQILFQTQIIVIRELEEKTMHI